MGEVIRKKTTTANGEIEILPISPSKVDELEK